MSTCDVIYILLCFSICLYFSDSGPEMKAIQFTTFLSMLFSCGVEGIGWKIANNTAIDDTLALTCNVTLGALAPRSSIEHAVSSISNPQCLALTSGDNGNSGYQTCSCPAEPNVAKLMNPTMVSVLKLRHSDTPIPGKCYLSWLLFL